MLIPPYSQSKLLRFAGARPSTAAPAHNAAVNHDLPPELPLLWPDFVPRSSPRIGPNDYEEFQDLVTAPSLDDHPATVRNFAGRSRGGVTPSQRVAEEGDSTKPARPLAGRAGRVGGPQGWRARRRRGRVIVANWLAGVRGILSARLLPISEELESVILQAFWDGVKFLRARIKGGVCKKYLGFYAVYCWINFAGPREARQNGKS